MPKFKVEAADKGKRTDVFIAQKFPKYTRSSLKQLFKLGLVTIDKAPIEAARKLKTAEEVAVDTKLLRTRPPKTSMPILYEDNDITVVDKPAGVLSHSKGVLNLEPTVASFIKSKLNDNKLTDNRAGIVHRLDRGTSGVMVTAKNQPTQKWLQKQFSTRKVAKAYMAILEGVPEPTQAIIDAPIGRNPAHPQTFKISPIGKTAKTYYRVIKSFSKNSKNYCLVEFRPETGRTHQLRIHAAYVGHPIVGDSVYGHGNGPIFLHAKSLELSLPSGKKHKFNSPLPPAFEEYTSL